jgi:RecB family exonuclease
VGPSVERVRMSEASGATGAAGADTVARGVLTTSEARGLLAKPRPYSISELEAYSTCPYRWFLERAVRPASLDARFDRSTAGTIVHDALAGTYRSLSGSLGDVRVTPENLDRALVVLHDVLEQLLREGPVVTGVEEEQALDAAKAACVRSLERDAVFLPGTVPAHTEWAFGREQGDEERVGDVLVSGRVDRIDVGPDGLVVVDYKLGEATPVAKFEERGLLQLQIYAIAASRRLDLPVAGGLYRGLKGAKDRGFYLKGLSSPGLVRNDACGPEQIQAVLEAAEGAVVAAAAGIRSGDIAPHREARRCAWCEWAPLCSGGAS